MVLESWLAQIHWFPSQFLFNFLSLIKYFPEKIHSFNFWRIFLKNNLIFFDLRLSQLSSWAPSMASLESSVQTNCTSQPNTEMNSSNLPNPYFLNPNENLGNILLTQPLLGMKNYHSWSRAMILALIAKKKIGFINGKIIEPNLKSPLYEDWLSYNTMVISWMINSMHVDVFSSKMYC